MADEANTTPAAPAVAPQAAAPAAAASSSTPAPVTPPPQSASAPSTPAPEAPAIEAKSAAALLSVEPTAKTDAPAGSLPAANSDAKTDAKVEALPGDKPLDDKAEASKTEDAKKDDAPKDGEPKKEEAAQSEETAPQPTYEAFKLPEGFTHDEAKLGEFTGLLAEVELAKGDHTKMQEFGQKLMDRHTAEVKNILQQQAEFYQKAFERQQNEWEAAFDKDPEIGGNQRETTLEYARQFISSYGGNADQQKAIREVLKASGIANHPEFIRLFATAQKSMTREGSPVPAQNLNTTPKSKVEKRYGKMT